MTVSVKIQIRNTRTALLSENDVKRIIKEYLVSNGAMAAGVRLDQTALLDSGGDVLMSSDFTFRWFSFEEAEVQA